MLRVKGAVVVMPGSNSSAGVGASHRPRLLWIPRVQRPPPLNPGDCSGRGKMPARAAESSPSATQQGSCRVCLLLSPSPHSPCQTVEPLHTAWPRAVFVRWILACSLETSLFRRFTFTSKACCQHPCSLHWSNFCLRSTRTKKFALRPARWPKFLAPTKKETLPDPAKAKGWRNR